MNGSKNRIDITSMGAFLFSLLMTFAICILSTFISYIASDMDKVSFEEQMLYFCIPIFSTTITFSVTMFSQNLIQIISKKLKGEDIKIKFNFITLGISVLYVFFYFIYLLKYTYLILAYIFLSISVVVIVLAICSFFEAYSVRKSSLVAEG